MLDTPLDNDLFDRIRENLKHDPSDLLREMLAPTAGNIWSPEAIQVARLLLEKRANGAAEPIYRTSPMAVSAGEGQSYQGHKIGDVVLAPTFSLPRGFSRLLFLGRFLGGACLYAARMGEIRGHAAYVYYYDGNRGWVRLADVKPIDVGTRLYCHWQGATGTVIYWQGTRTHFHPL